MITEKNITKLIILFLFFSIQAFNAQNIPVYKINDLLNRIHNNSDTTYVVNFWATWCKPCVAELPEFEKLHLNYKTQNIKTILVCMDFIEDIDKKLKPFLVKNKYTCEVILLDEINGNDFINKISNLWSGAIPATLITKKNKTIDIFIEKKVNYDYLVETIK